MKRCFVILTRSLTSYLPQRPYTYSTLYTILLYIVLFMCVCVWSVNKSYPYLTLGLYKRFIYIDGLPKDRWTGPNWCVHVYIYSIYHLFFYLLEDSGSIFFHVIFFYLLLRALYGPHLLLSIQTDFFDGFVLYLNPVNASAMTHLYIMCTKKNRRA